MAKKKRRNSSIVIKNPTEIESMRKAGFIASDVLQGLIAALEIGKSTKDMDDLAAELMKEHGVKSAFLNYHGFPGQICISVNEEVIHGIGSPTRILAAGDVVKMDVGVVANGWIGDNASTHIMGDVQAADLETRQLLHATEQSLFDCISYAKDGVNLADLCGSIEDSVRNREQKFGIVREFVGHGVGSILHEEPQIPNYRPLGKQPTLRSGMILAIEPMMTAGKPKVKILDDNWTVVTTDRKHSAHFEHTVLVTDNGGELLTDRPRAALESQLGLS